jgi:hypothetical protein
MEINQLTEVNMSAQDNKREKAQKKQFGLEDNNSRGDKFDSLYEAENGIKVKVDFKTRQCGKPCSTKRIFTKDTIKEWQDTIIVVSEYDRDNPDQICGDTVVLTPDIIKDWLNEQEQKLNKGSNTRLGHNDLKNISAPAEVIKKIEKGIHLGCPSISKKVLNSGIKVSSAKQLKNVLEEYSKKVINGGPNGKSIKNG